MKRNSPAQCVDCGKVGLLWGNYCRTPCHTRWLRAGKPAPDAPKVLTPVERLRQIPVIQSGREPNNIEVGTAGEHLVCADLLLSGYVAFLTDPGCAYDIAVDLGGRLIRLQVKSTRGPYTSARCPPAYVWHVRRNGYRGLRNYPEGAFDMLALVALDLRLVAYTPQQARGDLARIHLPGSPSSKQQFGDYPFGRALAQLADVPEQAEARARVDPHDE